MHESTHRHTLQIYLIFYYPEQKTMRPAVNMPLKIIRYTPLDIIKDSTYKIGLLFSVPSYTKLIVRSQPFYHFLWQI
jgi:hypothetical protein